MPNMVKLVLLSTLILACTCASGADVYQSSLDKNTVCVRLDPDEVEACKTVRGAARVSFGVTRQMMVLVGVPSSIVGKVAAVPVAATLAIKYARDFRRVAKTVGKGSNVTLGYPVNVERIKRIYKLGKLGDKILPGGKEFKTLISVINELVNATNR